MEFGLALLLDLIGAALALVLAARTWQTITTPRSAPLADDVLRVNGRTVDAAPTALALVALAGVVVILATRGLWRRVVGGVLALAGAGLIWRAIAASSTLSVSRARELVTERHPTVTFDLTADPAIAVSSGWAVLTACCGALLLVAGGLIAWRGATWAGMSARYERTAPVEDPEAAAARQNASLWSALDRGDDPTS